jgi:glycosyltransferase involved in cell wall biosynthesis
MGPGRDGRRAADCGRWRWLAEVKQRTGELGLEEQLTFGRLTAGEFAPLLAQADIGVSPYCGWNEFSGLKILDYKAAGLPAITSGLDGRPSTVSHGRTGLIVPPCDADALRDAIVNLCADEECRRQMGRAARLEAEARHTWEHTAASSSDPDGVQSIGASRERDAGVQRRIHRTGYREPGGAGIRRLGADRRG